MQVTILSFMQQTYSAKNFGVIITTDISLPLSDHIISHMCRKTGWSLQH